MLEVFFYCLVTKNIQIKAAVEISRILFRFRKEPAAIICLCDQNPELVALRAATRSLFGLAAEGVCLCGAAFAERPAGSYPAFSPLPENKFRRFFFCCTFLPAAYSPQYPSFTLAANPGC